MSIETMFQKLPKTFLETKKNLRNGQVEEEKEISDKDLLEKHRFNCDLLSWVDCSSVGSTFSIMAKGFYYKRIK